MSELALIAALDRNLAIGKGNALPWHLPDDLRRFKALTLGRTVLMGRRTAESLGRALPKRTNLVLSRSRYTPFEGMTAVGTLQEAIDLAGGDGLAVIGGGEIYALTLPLATRMHLTHVDTVVADADAFFPAFDPSHWRVERREAHAADATHAFAFEFVDYARA
jgi:dihydrofolate reductase